MNRSWRVDPFCCEQYLPCACVEPVFTVEKGLLRLCWARFHCGERTLALVLSPFSLWRKDSCACVEPVFTVEKGLLRWCWARFHCGERTLVLVLSPFSLWRKDSCACVEPVFTVEKGLLRLCWARFHCEERTLVLVLSPFSLWRKDSCACVEPFTLKCCTLKAAPFLRDTRIELLWLLLFYLFIIVIKITPLTPRKFAFLPCGHTCLHVNPFTPKSDQCQISPAASPNILQHTAWRTWLFIAYSDERWLYYQFSKPHSYISSWKGRENVH